MTAEQAPIGGRRPSLPNQKTARSNETPSSSASPPISSHNGGANLANILSSARRLNHHGNLAVLLRRKTRPFGVAANNRACARPTSYAVPLHWTTPTRNGFVG